MATVRPILTSLYSMRRRLATAGVVVFTLWLFAHVMFGANGMVVYRQKKAEYQNLQKQIVELQKENDRYSHQVKSLQTPIPPPLKKKLASSSTTLGPEKLFMLIPMLRRSQPRAGRRSRWPIFLSSDFYLTTPSSGELAVA